MNLLPQASSAIKIKTAAAWLWLVAAATLLNSVILYKYMRFIDLLIGFSFTQLIDAAFLGMQLEPQSSRWWIDALPLDAIFVLSLLLLAAGVSRRNQRATLISLCVYSIDTSLFALSFGWSFFAMARGNFHAARMALVWQVSTLIAHTLGVLIILRAWRTIKEMPVAQNERT
jgi:hypothetical protein